MTDEIFSRHRRRLNRARALRADADSRWLTDRAVQELVERYRLMTIEVRRALVFGDGVAALRAALPAECQIISADLISTHLTDLVCDEDRLALSEGKFDLVFASGTLESVHDLPGALVLFRRVLRPGGLFLGSLVGNGAIAAFRTLVQSTETQNGAPAAARFHPQVDVRSAGDLLFRTGYSTPVADMDEFDVNYTSASRLVHDLRANGLGNALPEVHRFGRATGRHILKSGAFRERFAHIYLTGWAPQENEVRPSGPVKGYV